MSAKELIDWLEQCRDDKDNKHYIDNDGAAFLKQQGIDYRDYGLGIQDTPQPTGHGYLVCGVWHDDVDYPKGTVKGNCGVCSDTPVALNPKNLHPLLTIACFNCAQQLQEPEN